METPYDLKSVSRTYQYQHMVIDRFVSGQIDLVALNIAHLRRQKPFVRAVDFGCGAGGFYEHLSKRLVRSETLGVLHYLGIDASATQIAAAQRDFMECEALTFRRGSVLDGKLSDRMADISFECRLMQFLEQPIEALAEMIRVSDDLICATLYTLPTVTAGFHPFFTQFSCTEKRAIVSGGAPLRELDYANLSSRLLRQNGDPDPKTGHIPYTYIFARQRRVLPSHDQLATFLRQAPVDILYHQVIEAAFDHLQDRPGVHSGVTDDGDRYQSIKPQWHTLVMARRP